ncbi:hypothetical protein CUMW_145780 [Citrus unshiu]|nr:hypothetical protein CUMW_145780 [Citrus unshiu]
MFRVFHVFCHCKWNISEVHTLYSPYLSLYSALFALMLLTKGLLLLIGGHRLMMALTIRCRSSCCFRCVFWLIDGNQTQTGCLICQQLVTSAQSTSSAVVASLIAAALLLIP